MKFCPKCGAELKEGAKFCPACGSQIPEEQTTQAPPPPAFEPQAAVNAFTDTFKGNTNIVQRVINILTKPKQEWLVISNENPDKAKLIFGYVLILALVPAIVNFINFAFISSYFPITYAIVQAIMSLVISIGILYLGAFIVDALASSFDSEKNFDRSFQLLSYAYTPVWVASLLGFIPGLNIVASLVGFAYMVYLIITGLPFLKRTPQGKETGYGIVIVLVMIVLFVILGLIMSAIFIGGLFRSSMYGM